MEIILSDVFRPVRVKRDQVRSSSKQFLYLNFFNTFIKYIDYYEQWREHFGHLKKFYITQNLELYMKRKLSEIWNNIRKRRILSKQTEL